MKIPFRLLPGNESENPRALLLLSQQTSELFRLCEQLECDPLPKIYLVADGYLLVFPENRTLSPPGVLRLQALVNNLYLPLKAKLIPPLLPDEATALVRNRGLVFLPGGRVLEFQPDQPIPLGKFLQIDNLPNNQWRSLPEPPFVPDKVRSFRLELPEPPVEEILEQGGEDIGSEVDDREDPSPGKKILNNAGYGLGKGLAWLGEKLGSKGLAKAGAKMMGGALSQIPKLSEKVLGKQESMLRRLLQDFKEGKSEEALRRALPIGGNAPRGSKIANNAHLPIHNLFYSLGNILGSGGPASVWFGGSDDVYRQLEEEYRRLAIEATKKGDYRRAAFIYGKLLSDFSSAAKALSAGGLHRDAAIIFLTKLNDSHSAAKEFEAAGEFERALELYRESKQYVIAAELLRRIGEEEQAIREFQTAANWLIESGQGHYAAGELLLRKAGRPDLAFELFSQGWQQRPNGSYLNCVESLAEHHTKAENVEGLLGLVDEADRFFKQEGRELAAGSFYNRLAQLAEKPELKEVRGDLQDRALLALAGKLRQKASDQSYVPNLISNLMGPNTVWSSATVSDAEYAVTITKKKKSTGSQVSKGGYTATVIPAQVDIVTAVCHAQGSGVIFLGFQSGEVFQFNPKNNRILAITTEKGPIISLATDTEGTKLVVLSRKGAELNRIGIYSQATGFRMNYQDQIRLLGDIWLAPNLGYKNDSSAFAFCCEDRLEIRDADIGLPISRVYFDAPGSNLNRPKAMFWLPTSNGELVLLGKNCLQYVKGVKFKSLAERYIAWKPFLPKRSSLVCPQVAWYWGENKLELAGVNSEGLLTWIEVFPHEATDKITLGEKRFFSEPVRAFAFTGFRNLAAVRSESVDFLRVGQEGKTVKRKLSLPFPDAVACFANGRQQLLSVICINGLVAQVEY